MAKKITKKVAKKKVVKKKTIKKKAVRRKQSTDVVITSPVNPDSHIVMASEIADDAMIEAELTGEVLTSYIYEFSQGGKKVTGLTVQGVNEVVRKLNRNKKSGYKITFPPEHLKIERNVDYDGQIGVEVSLMAVNLIDGTTAFGIKFEPYKKTKSGGGTYTNDFAVEKALSKAERNAKRKLIPEVVATKMIAAMIKTDPNVVRQIEAPLKVIQTEPVKAKSMTTAEKFEKAKGMIASIKTRKTIKAAMQQIQDSDIYDKAQKDKLVEELLIRENELENEK